MVRMDSLAPKGIFEDEDIFTVTPVAELDEYVLDDYAFDEYDDDRAAWLLHRAEPGFFLPGKREERRPSQGAALVLPFRDAVTGRARSAGSRAASRPPAPAAAC